MMLSELLIKISQQQPLTPNELEQLRQYGKVLDDAAELSKSIFKNGAMTFQNPFISNPNFTSAALSVATLTRTTDTAITTGTDTPVSWESLTGKQKVFRWELADPTKIRLTYLGQAFEIDGYVGWEANATGYRNVKIEGFTDADVSLGGAVLYSAPGWTGTDNVNHFGITIAENNFPTMAYFKITVGHTRGSDLNLLFINLGLKVA